MKLVKNRTDLLDLEWCTLSGYSQQSETVHPLSAFTDRKTHIS